MSGERLFEVLSTLKEISDPADLQRLFERIVAVYGLKTIAYLGTGFGRNPSGEPYIAATYSLDWIDRYKARNYVEIDPVLQIGMRRMLPVDWGDFGQLSGEVRDFFGEATEFGLGRRGLSVPIHGRHGDRALLSITSDLSGRDWFLERQHYTRDFQVLAIHTHALLLQLEGTPPRDVRLSPRERECLRWIAEGKTAWECAVILGLSPHTVRCYLESARHKLAASSNTHAVAKAIKADLLSVIP